MDFMERVKLAMNMYDLMAAAYHELLPFSPSRLESARPLQDMTIRDYVVTCASEMPRNGKFFSDFKRYLLAVDVPEEDKCDFFLEIVDSVDKAYPYNFLSEDYAGSAYTINNLTADAEIIILPVLEHSLCMHLDKDLAHTGNRWLRDRKNFISAFNCEMHNYVVYPKNELRYDVHVVQIADRKHFSRRLEGKKSLNVTIFPLSNQNLNRLLDIKYARRTFSISGMRPGVLEDITTRYLRSLQTVMEHDEIIDIVIFPEMLFSLEVVPHIQEFLDRQPPEKLPGLIILGTYWLDARNRCVVMDMNGTEIYRQDKHTPYKISQTGHIEALNLDNRDIYLLDIEGFGRIITPICKDLDNDQILTIIKNLHCQYLFCPAYSDSQDIAFHPGQLAASHQVYSFIGNACSSLCGKEEETPQKSIGAGKPIGYVCLPRKVDTTRDANAIPYSFRENCSQCHTGCNGHLLMLRYTEMDERAGDKVFQQLARFTT